MSPAGFLTTRNALIAVLTLAAALRLLGIDYGLPHAFRADEESIIGGAMRMMQLKTLIPALHPVEMEIMNYPPYLPYVYMAALTPVIVGLYLLHGMPDIQTLQLLVFENMGAFFLAARMTSVIFSVLMVWIVYRIGRALFAAPGVALFAALMQSIDFISNFSAHFARHWNATTFLVWLAVYFAIRLAQDSQRKTYIIVGAISGLGFGVSYSFGGLGIVAGGIAHLYQMKGRDWQLGELFSANALIMAGVFLVLGGLSIALHPNAVLRLLVGDIAGLDEAKSLLGWIEGLVYYLRGMVITNPALLLASLGATGLAISRRHWRMLLWGWGTVLFYLSLLYFTVSLEDRYLITIIPAFALGGGYFLASLVRVSSGPVAIARWSVAALVISYPLLTAGQTSALFARSDTREQAIAWMDANLPAQAKVVFDLGGATIRPTAAALSHQQDIAPGSLSAHMRALRSFYATPHADTSILMGRTYHAVHPRRFEEPVLSASQAAAFLETWTAQGYEYFVIQFRSPLHDTALNKRIRAEGERLAQFRPTSGDILPPYLRSTVLTDVPVHTFFTFDRFGPIVEIYRIRNNAKATP